MEAWSSLVKRRPAPPLGASVAPLPRSAWRLTTLLCVVSTADWYLQLTLFWIAASRGWSGLQLAGIVLAARAPTLLGGVLGGRLVDRLGPRTMFEVDAVVRGTALGLLTLAAVLHVDGYWVIAAGAAACATSAPTSYASARTLMPRLVTAAQTGRASTALTLGDQLPVVLSGLVAGPVLSWAAPAAFGVPALLMAVGLLLARRMPPTPPLDVPVHEGPRRRTPWPRSVIALVTLSTVYFFVYGPFQPLLPDLVRSNLQGDAATYSAMRACLGVGALVGLAFAPWLCARSRPGVVNALGAVAYGLVVFPLVLVHSVPVAIIVYFLSGVVWGPYAAVEATALQRWTPPAEHGRVFGTQRALVISAIPAGGAIGSLALDHLDVATILGASALACTAAGLVALGSRSIRRS